MADAPDPLARMQSALAALRDKRVFFIGGAPKSGTTWLQLLLDAHPAISCRGEGHLPNHLAPLLADAARRQNELVAAKNAALFPGLPGHPLLTGDDLLSLLGAAVGLLLLRPERAAAAAVLGEKTPNNASHFPLLRRVFPQARFLHLVRDGRDCAVSAWFHRLRLNPEELAAEYGSMAEYLPRAARAWAHVVGAGAAFADAHPESCATIRYEDLLAAPEATLGALLGTLGVAADGATVRACLAAADFGVLSGGRRRGEEDRASFFRQGTAGGWRRHFDPGLLAAFAAEAGPALARFGYA